MPSGTLYHEWEPCIFHSLHIKDETIPPNPAWPDNTGDWFEVAVPQLDVSNSDQDCDVQMRMAEKGVSHPMGFDMTCREALFDDNKKYAVWERDDVAAFVDCLKQYLKEE